MAQAAVIQNLPELLKQGIEVYGTVKTDMERAMGLKQYADHLKYLASVMKEVNRYLKQEEQAVALVLNQAYSLANEGLVKARLVVATIKEQCAMLSSILGSQNAGRDQHNCFAAISVFRFFAATTATNLAEVEAKLRGASSRLQSAGSTIQNITSTLKRIHDRLVIDMKKAQNNQLPLVGMLGGPTGQIISDCFPVDVTIMQPANILKIVMSFEEQRKIISGYVTGFQTMHTEVTTFKQAIDQRRALLVDIHGKLASTSNLSGQVHLLPVTLLPVLRTNVSSLVAACVKFLAEHKLS